jgi:hypothetical protein
VPPPLKEETEKLKYQKTETNFLPGQTASAIFSSTLPSTIFFCAI